MIILVCFLLKTITRRRSLAGGCLFLSSGVHNVAILFRLLCLQLAIFAYHNSTIHERCRKLKEYNPNYSGPSAAGCHFENQAGGGGYGGLPCRAAGVWREQGAGDGGQAGGHAQGYSVAFGGTPSNQ